MLRLWIRNITLKSEKFWETLGEMDEVDQGKQWFQQDGAIPHCANLTLQWLEGHFEDRVISRRTDVEWSPYPPDWNPPDFFLWGFLKDHVYKGQPQTIPELQEAITTETQAIGQEQHRKSSITLLDMWSSVLSEMVPIWSMSSNKHRHHQ